MVKSSPLNRIVNNTLQTMIIKTTSTEYTI